MADGASFSARRTTPLPRLRHARADALVNALTESGCAVVEDAIPADLVDRLQAEMAPWFERTPPGEGVFFGRRTRRFSAIFAKAPSTVALALHEDILSAIETVLLGPASDPHADRIQITLTQAIAIEPGEPAQLLHRDDELYPFPKPFELMVNVMWPLDDFDARNGATRLAPASQYWPREAPEADGPGVVDAEARAGSAIIWLGSLVHGGGANRSDRMRRGVVISYALAWLAQAEKLLLSIPVECARTLPERLQQLIGYQTHRPNLGWVEGRDPLDWLAGRVGLVAAATDQLTPSQAELLEQLRGGVA